MINMSNLTNLLTDPKNVIFYNSPIPIAMHMNDKWIYINPAGLNLLGTNNPDNIIGKSIYDFIHPAYHDIESSRIEDLKKKHDDIFPIEEKIIRLNGEVIDVEINTSYIEYQNQPVFQVIIYDITRHKIKEELYKTEYNRFQLLFEQAPDAYFLCDTKGIIVNGNTTFENIIGTPKNEFINTNILKSNIIHQSQIINASNIFVNLKLGNAIPSKEIIFLHKNGSTIPLELNCVPIKIRSQILILFQARDISEREMAEKELKDSKERLHRLSEATFEGILLSDNDRIMDTNFNLAYMLEYLPIEMNNVSIFDIFASDQKQNLIIYFKSDQDKPFETIARKKNGSTFPVEVLYRNAPFHDRIIKILAIRDITERKRLERLREDTERIIHHDLKNPLNGIIGFSNVLLANPKLTEDQRKYLTFINENGYTVLHMINHSLDLFKMEEGTYQFHPHPCDIISILKKINMELMNILKMKRITLNYFCNNIELSWENSIIVNGIKIHLASLFANLLKNALEASPENHPVTININEMDDILIIDIHNIGVIPQEIREHFFERYVTSGKKGGTGIGTYSARLIAKTHKGSIKFTTSESEGTHLIVTLPVCN